MIDTIEFYPVSNSIQGVREPGGAVDWAGERLRQPPFLSPSSSSSFFPPRVSENKVSFSLVSQPVAPGLGQGS